MENGKRLVIVDSSALLFRAFFALPPLKNTKGQETGAVYGFLTTLFKAINDTHATHVVACFDMKKKTFRHEEFKDYKAHRAPTPEGIVSQIPIAKDVVRAFGIPLFEKEGFEADDLIATICKLCEGHGDLEVYIVSGDLDNLQLVSEQVRLYTLGKGIKDTLIYDTMKVQERFGVLPTQMVEFKALIGDASDNIPGVKGIGKKTAAEIINKYGTVENLYAELATDTAVLKPKVKEALKANKDSARMSRRLVEMKHDVPVEFSLDACAFGGYDKQKAEAALNHLEFYSLINRIINTPTP